MTAARPGLALHAAAVEGRGSHPPDLGPTWTGLGSRNEYGKITRRRPGPRRSCDRSGDVTCGAYDRAGGRWRSDDQAQGSGRLPAGTSRRRHVRSRADKALPVPAPRGARGGCPARARGGCRGGGRGGGIRTTRRGRGTSAALPGAQARSGRRFGRTGAALLMGGRSWQPGFFGGAADTLARPHPPSPAESGGLRAAMRACGCGCGQRLEVGGRARYLDSEHRAAARRGRQSAARLPDPRRPCGCGCGEIVPSGRRADARYVNDTHARRASKRRAPAAADEGDE